MRLQTWCYLQIYDTSEILIRQTHAQFSQSENLCCFYEDVGVEKFEFKVLKYLSSVK